LFAGTALGLFVALNVAGSGPGLLAAGSLVALVAARLLLAAAPGSVAGIPRSLPFVFFCAGALVFSASWSPQPFTDWVRWGIRESNVAIGLCLLTLGLIAALIGTRTGDWLTRVLPPGRRWWPERSTWLIGVSLVCLAVGWMARAWAWWQGLYGFWVDAYGVDFTLHSGRFVTMLLAFRSLADIGQTGLCLVLLRAGRSRRSEPEARTGRALLGLVLILSLAADLILRLQSASRGGFLLGFVPLLATAYMFGYSRRVRWALVAGSLAYAAGLFSFFSAMRVGGDYRSDIESGRVYVPSVASIFEPAGTRVDSIEGAFSRLNQASVLGAAVQAADRGVPPLLEVNYVAALATLVPRVVAQGRDDEQISYDAYTNLPSATGFYNNWGLISESVVNFGFAGALLVPFIVGLVWQVVFIRLLDHGPSFGWCLAATLWLPSVLHCGEYAFLPGVLSPLKIMLGLTLFLMALVVLLEGVLAARRIRWD